MQLKYSVLQYQKFTTPAATAFHPWQNNKVSSSRCSLMVFKQQCVRRQIYTILVVQSE